MGDPSETKKIRVLHLMRRAPEGFYSVERLYEDVRAYLPEDLTVGVRVSRYCSRGVLRRIYNILEVLRRGADVYHVTGDVHFLTYLLPRKRTVLTILDCGTLESSQGLKRWLFWLLWYWLPQKRCAAIVVISESTKMQLLRYLCCDPAKIHVIHCNVSEEFQPDRKRAFIQGARLLQVGTTPNKNLERVALALRGINCLLVVIGRLNEAQRVALESNGVRFEVRVGLSRADLLDEYRGCDVLVFASTYEGFGLPIVEANAVGRPVVTSNILSMPEVAGEAACLVNPFDVESIRQGILRVLEDASYREELVQRGLKNAKRFRTRAIAGQYAALYRELGA